MSTYYYYGDTLYHHGIKGQKWGIRKYQNEDGSLTAAGREHYGYGEARKTYKNKIDAANDEYRYARKETKRAIASLKKNRNTMSKDEYDEYLKEFKSYPSTSKKILKARKNAAKQEYKNSDEYKARKEKIKKAAIVGAAVAATALTVYGAYKINEFKKNKEAERYKEIGKAYQKVSWSIWDGWVNEFHGKRNADGSRDYGSGRVYELDKALKNSNTEDERRLLNAKINRARFDEKNRRRAMDRATDRAIYYNNKAYK